MEFWGIACRHLACFFQISIEYNLDSVDFALKALNSNYKLGIEQYRHQWYSQRPYYYFEEFMEENKVKPHIFNNKDIDYEKERMYWLGFCLQDWCNKTKLNGKDIAKIYGENGIKHLIDNYKVYHTVDAMYVLEDTIEINNLNINFNEILNIE